MRFAAVVLSAESFLMPFLHPRAIPSLPVVRELTLYIHYRERSLRVQTFPVHLDLFVQSAGPAVDRVHCNARYRKYIRAEIDVALDSVRCSITPILRTPRYLIYLCFNFSYFMTLIITFIYPSLYSYFYDFYFFIITFFIGL